MTEPFKFSSGQLAYTAEDLIKLCGEFRDESLEFLMREDFEKWLNYINKPDVAAIARQIRQNSLPDGDRINAFITQYQNISVSPKISSPKTAKASTNKKVKNTSTKVRTTSTDTKKPNFLVRFFKNLSSKKQVAPNQD